MLPPPERPRLRRVLWAPGVVLIALIAVAVLAGFWLPSRAAGLSPIRLQTKNGWQPVPAPFATYPADTVRMSSGGLHVFGPGATSQYDWSKTAKALAGAAVFLLLIYSAAFHLSSTCPSRGFGSW